jgi:hypothetical protein
MLDKNEHVAIVSTSGPRCLHEAVLQTCDMMALTRDSWTDGFCYQRRRTRSPIFRFGNQSPRRRPTSLTSSRGLLFLLVQYLVCPIPEPWCETGVHDLFD